MKWLRLRPHVRTPPIRDLGESAIHKLIDALYNDPRSCRCRWTTLLGPEHAQHRHNLAGGRAPNM